MCIYDWIHWLDVNNREELDRHSVDFAARPLVCGSIGSFCRPASRKGPRPTNSAASVVPPCGRGLAQTLRQPLSSRPAEGALPSSPALGSRSSRVED